MPGGGQNRHRGSGVSAIHYPGRLHAALLFAALSAGFMVGLSGCEPMVPATTVTQDIVTTTVTEAATTTTSAPRLSVDLGSSQGNDPGGSSSSSPPRNAFDAHGGNILFTCSFGSKAGQIGLEEQEGIGSSGLHVSVSPDGQTIAISDPANMRVQLFNRSGALRRTIPVGAQDLVLGPGGRLFVLAWDNKVGVVEADGTESCDHMRAGPL